MPNTRLICPECGAETLSIVQGIELPPDRWSDEISLGRVHCTNCAFQGIAVYEESRRGALDSESWRHIGYRAGEELCALLQRAISACSEPGNKNCQCSSHTLLGSQNSLGEWNWTRESGLDKTQTFEIRIAGAQS